VNQVNFICCFTALLPLMMLFVLFLAMTASVLFIKRGKNFLNLSLSNEEFFLVVKMNLERGIWFMYLLNIIPPLCFLIKSNESLLPGESSIFFGLPLLAVALHCVVRRLSEFFSDEIDALWFLAACALLNVSGGIFTSLTANHFMFSLALKINLCMMIVIATTFLVLYLLLVGKIKKAFM
jgi:hypothetical protein